SPRRLPSRRGRRRHGPETRQPATLRLGGCHHHSARRALEKRTDRRNVVGRTAVRRTDPQPIPRGPHGPNRSVIHMNRMRTFSVWAPNPESVEIELAGRRHRLQRDHEGTWSGTFDDVPPDAEYGFIVDGEGPFPDPRSPRQRSGVHGLSTLVDHAAFPWTDAGFQAPPLSSGLIYELHIGTFTPEGTFDAAIERLDHLRELGVTHVEIMPVNAFSGTHGW